MLHSRGMGVTLSTLRTSHPVRASAANGQPPSLRLRRYTIPPRPETEEAMARALQHSVLLALPNIRAIWPHLSATHRHTALAHGADIALATLLAWNPNEAAPPWNLMVVGMRAWINRWAFRDAVWLIDPAILAQPMRTWPWFDPGGGAA